ncbi:LOW QUALITY PROTEIN: fatty-acid amide hydrolase 2-like [Atheta coriaria]|uniref:LOW QUALITY PROTEIN: fatty-acid amide hydrolase 2-like n=1 Tax=Dalotia coriaria TaxID=877792 RepID=UPI0031F3D375
MEILLRLVLFLMRIISWLVIPIFGSFVEKTPKITPIKNHILLLSATTLADKIRKREMKSETVVTAYIERIKEVNPILNAVVEDRFEDALQDAKAVDEYLNKTIIDPVQLEKTQPLLGVPITIKESCGVKGMSQACGSLQREGFRAAQDGAAVARIRRAGGIILLVSNTPEFCLYWESNNRITGRTNNPYHIKYSPGGSSGGEGALLGAGASIIGIGSDVAGSLRLPALLNGVFAHKCTANLVDSEGHFPNAQSDMGKFNFTVGPMVRYAEDLPLVFKVLTDHSFELGLDDQVDLKSLNIFHMFNAGASIAHVAVDSEIKQAINKCVTHLQHVCGANVDQFKFSMSNTMEITAAVLLYLNDLPNILGNPISDKQNDWLLFELLKYPFGCSKYSFNGLIFSF